MKHLCDEVAYDRDAVKKGSFEKSHVTFTKDQDRTRVVEDLNH